MPVATRLQAGGKHYKVVCSWHAANKDEAQMGFTRCNYLVPTGLSAAKQSRGRATQRWGSAMYAMGSIQSRELTFSASRKVLYSAPICSSSSTTVCTSPSCT